MKRVTIRILGFIIVGFALFLGIKFIGFPVAITKYSEPPIDNEIIYYEDKVESKSHKVRIRWWRE